MAGVGRGAVPGGGRPAMDEAAEAERVGVGSKRARDRPSATDSYGFVGAIAGGKKPTVQPHSNAMYLKKAGNVPVLPNIDGTSKIGGLDMHGTHGSESSPESNALRLGKSSPGGDLKNNTIKPTRICIFYAQGRCRRGNSCTFLHEGEVTISDNQGSKEGNAGMLAQVGYGNHRGTEEGSEIQHLSNLKEPHFRNSVGSTQDEIYRSLVQKYGEHNRGLTVMAHPIDKHNSHMLGVSHGFKFDDLSTTKPNATRNEVVQLPVVQEKNYGHHCIGHKIGLTTNSCLDDRDAFSRLHPNGGNVTKGHSPRDPLLSRSYLEVNPLKPDYHSTIPFGMYGFGKSSAYAGATENLPYKHQEEKSSISASRNLNSLTGFRNRGYGSSDYSLVNPSFQPTPHPGIVPLHQLTPGKDASYHKDADFDKGGTSSSRATSLVSSSPQPVIASAGQLSPIRDEVWITSVPFVPSFNFPDSTSPSKGQHDSLCDGISPPKVKSLNYLKSSNISCSISSQHGDGNVIREGSIEKSLVCNDKLARNVSAKNEFTGFISCDRGRSSSLDGDNKVKTCERKSDAALNNEKARDFRFQLVEHVKELVKPIWKEGNLSKDAHKLIVKKSVDKVFASLEEVPDTEESIRKYIAISGSKIEKLVKAYVDRHRTA